MTPKQIAAVLFRAHKEISTAILPIDFEITIKRSGSSDGNDALAAQLEKLGWKRNRGRYCDWVTPPNNDKIVVFTNKVRS